MVRYCRRRCSSNLQGGRTTDPWLAWAMRVGVSRIRRLVVLPRMVALPRMGTGVEVRALLWMADAELEGEDYHEDEDEGRDDLGMKRTWETRYNVL